MARILLAAVCLLSTILAAHSGLIGESEAVRLAACAWNEVFNDCGTACPETCPIRDAKTGEIKSGVAEECIQVCKVGCQCVKGFVRDRKRNNACVQRALCSAP